METTAAPANPENPENPENPATGHSPSRFVQGTFDDLGTPLAQVPFVVVDLETTGGSPAECQITEIGAVKVLGGVVQGELQTLVNPGVPIPPLIVSLTGITTAAVASAPRIGAVLPTFFEFARGCVLVAHNAGFDVGFLKAACRTLDEPWPGYPVVDTARLARVLLHRDEIPNHRLASLAHFFRAGTVPNHRALADARATVDVLHGLLERAGSMGAHYLDDVVALSSRVRPEQRRKRTLADGLPDRPGVYVFVGPNDQTLYVGKAKSIRTRVRSYFTAAETRSRIIEMVRIAHHVEPIVCATELEAQVREVRLITERQPPYNRRSRNANKPAWLTVTEEPVPRLSIVAALPPRRRPTDPPRVVVGPFPSRAAAADARAAVHEAFPLRTCTTRLSSRANGTPCLRAELGTCLAPCQDPAALPRYAELVTSARNGLQCDQSPVVAALEHQMATYASTERFEEAAAARNRLHALLRASDLTADLSMLGACPQIVAAAPDGADWTIHVIRHGRLAATARASPQQDPRDAVDAAVATAEAVAPPRAGLTSALAEESQLVWAWLTRPQVRLVRLDGYLAVPFNPARATSARLAQAATLRRSQPTPAPG